MRLSDVTLALTRLRVDVKVTVMEMRPYVDQVRSQLAAAALLGDEQTRRIAEALSAAAEPAVRLALLSAASTLADEVTAALLDLPGAPTVSIRTDGDELQVQVRPVEPTGGAAPPRTEEADANARISLRLSEQLKADIDAAARTVGASVNTWLVRTAASAVAQGLRPGAQGGSSSRGGHRLTGWIDG